VLAVSFTAVGTGWTEPHNGDAPVFNDIPGRNGGLRPRDRLDRSTPPGNHRLIRINDPYSPLAASAR